MVSLNIRSRYVAPSLAVLALGCLGPNPYLITDEDETSTLGETGDGDGDGDGDGEGGDGDGDDLPPNCNNATLDGDETDVDCGGSCGPCDDGSACVEQTDCLSQVCSGELCQAPSCDDDVQNGDELGVDCGGSACGFCAYGAFVTELDDYEGSAATRPRVAMFADGNFAVTYNGPMEARARWFDELGGPLGPSVAISENIQFPGNIPIPVVAGEGPEHPIHVLEAGVANMVHDLWLVRLTQAGADLEFQIDENNQDVKQGDLWLEGSVATISWDANDDILTRRFDYDIAMGMWNDIEPFNPETNPAFDGNYVSVAQNADGIGVVAWYRCDAGICNISVRRFDAGWIDPEPVDAPPIPGELPIDPQVAIADDGRVAVLMRLLGIEESGMAAWLLDENLESLGDPWILQEDLPHPGGGIVEGDVAALSDGSFAFVWPDAAQDRVHVRRYVGPDMPKLPEVGDESPWPTLQDPNFVSASAIDGRLVVVWSAVVDSVRQVQGQVLAY